MSDANTSQVKKQCGNLSVMLGRRMGIEISLSSFTLGSSQPGGSQEILVYRTHASRLAQFPQTMDNWKLKI